MSVLHVINRVVNVASIAAVAYVGWQVVSGVDDPRFFGPTVALVVLSLASELFVLYRRRKATQEAAHQTR